MGKAKKHIRSHEECENLRTVFDAILDYHNNLVHMRFTVAGLYVAATGFLASSWFSSLGRQNSSAYLLIPVLGFILTLVCWLLEIRTYQLLDNLARMGRSIESMLGIGKGFFALMKRQPLRPKYPFTKTPLPASEETKRVISHSFGLSLLYGSILIFWFFIPWLK